jgi:photosystem II stability/assembly factor-like uncharacterized protein
MRMLSQHTGWVGVRDFAPDSGNAAGSDGVFRTIDCGATWADVTPAQLRGHLGIITLTAVDADDAWVVAWDQNGTPTTAETWRTSDGGASWQRTDVSIRPEGDPTIFFLDRVHGWLGIPVAGLSAGNFQARLFSTADGGASWTPVRGELAGGTVPVAGVMFIDAEHGWGVPDAAQGGDLYGTNDGGHSWKPAVIPAPDGFTGPRQPVGLPIFADARNGVLPVRLGTATNAFPVAGLGGTVRLDLYATHDGGGRWTPTTPLSDVPAASAFAILPSVGVLSASQWIVATEATLYITGDAGTTWQATPSTMGLPPSRGASYPTITLVASAFPSKQAWWVVYEPLGCVEGCDLYGILRTADAGRTWFDEKAPAP